MIKPHNGTILDMDREIAELRALLAEQTARAERAQQLYAQALLDVAASEAKAEHALAERDRLDRIVAAYPAATTDLARLRAEAAHAERMAATEHQARQVLLTIIAERDLADTRAPKARVEQDDTKYTVGYQDGARDGREFARADLDLKDALVARLRAALAAGPAALQKQAGRVSGSQRAECLTFAAETVKEAQQRAMEEE